MKGWKFGAAAVLGLTLVAPVAFAEDVPMSELPTEVRDTVQREIGQAEIGDIERDEEQGSTVYEIEFRENQQKFELDVAPDGRVLSRHDD